jgi:hypothetical protein
MNSLPPSSSAASQTASATASASANGSHALMNSRSRRICANRIAYEFSHPRLDLFVAEFRIWVATSRRRHAANKPAHRFHRLGKRSRQVQDRLGASVANSPRRNWKWKVYFSALRPVRAAEKRSLFSEWISLDKRAAIVDGTGMLFLLPLPLRVRCSAAFFRSAARTMVWRVGFGHAMLA